MIVSRQSVIALGGIVMQQLGRVIPRRTSGASSLQGTRRAGRATRRRGGPRSSRMSSVASCVRVSRASGGRVQPRMTSRSTPSGAELDRGVQSRSRSCGSWLRHAIVSGSVSDRLKPAGDCVRRRRSLWRRNREEVQGSATSVRVHLLEVVQSGDARSSPDQDARPARQGPTLSRASVWRDTCGSRTASRVWFSACRWRNGGDWCG